MAKTKNKGKKSGSVPRNVKEPMMILKRSTSPQAVTKINVDGGRGLSFTLAQLPGVSDFSSTFKYYKILSVKLTYELRTPNISGTTPFPRLWLAFDNGSGAVPGSLDEVASYNDNSHFQYGTSRVTYSRTFRPEPLITVGGQTGLIAQGSRWINTTSQSVAHFAVREWIEHYNTISTPNTVIDVTYQYTIAVKGVR